ncbi:prephenate dehydrogenase (NADP(+)) [Ranunculus cassubicifolius]
MASLHLCNPSTSLHQTETQFSTTSTSKKSSITTPYKFKTNKQCNLRVHSLPQLHPQLISCSDKSFEPSTSSSSSTRTHESPLRIGIIGLGAFGQFLAKAFQRQGHNVLGTSRSDYSEYCKEHDIKFFQDLDGLCEEQPDVLLVCSSIVSTEKVVRGIPFHKLKPNTIIADVLSVKQFAKNLLLEVVPSGFGVLCTHPMFGKYSGKNSWEGLRFVYDKVRVTENSIQEKKCQQFLDIFQDEGCKMVEMTCEEHDQYAAESQFVTHTVARILSNMNLEATPIDTKGYETLMELTQNTVSHGSDLYDGLFLYNVNSAKQIQKLEKAFDTVKKSLFGKLRESFKKQMEETETIENPMLPIQRVQFLPSSEKVLKDVSSFSMVAEQQHHTVCA